MTIPVALCGDYKASQLKSYLGEEDKGWLSPQALAGALALAAIYDGASRTEAGEDWRRDAADHPGLGDTV